MIQACYEKLAEVLDTLPNGFPATKDGVEMKILEKIFTPEDAELFCELKLTWETAKQISERTGQASEDLEPRLAIMAERGQIFSVELGGTRIYKMMPWIFGIYELQLPRMDEELALLARKYNPVFAQQFLDKKPQLMSVVPVEKTIGAEQTALPYEQVSHIIENGRDFQVSQCICRKENRLVGEPCEKTPEGCLAIAPVPGIFKDSDVSRVITKTEAYDIIRRAEEEALVHMTYNVQEGQHFICNCCGCSCGVLQGINKLGIPAGQVVRSAYHARIDTDSCEACGICKEERCQVSAISETDDVYTVHPEQCIGCGLCISSCPTDAIELVRRENAQEMLPPQNESEWYKERGRIRGVAYEKYM
ncbi:MAG: 4Fe-4S binding protein [Desulfobacteraceae bacterium]|nr:4Fe-4S binding protein [Desulfobacteraceae bacterium]